MTKEEALRIINSIDRNILTDEECYAVDNIFELVGSSLPSELDDAAQKVEDYYDVGEEHGYLYCHRGDIKDAFKAGAEWMAGQGVTEEYDVDEDGIFLDSDSLGVCLTAWPPSELHCEEGDTLIIQMRKRKSGESLNEEEDD